MFGELNTYDLGWEQDLLMICARILFIQYIYDVNLNRISTFKKTFSADKVTYYNLCFKNKEGDSIAALPIHGSLLSIK